jgi:hypothetical protein
MKAPTKLAYAHSGDAGAEGERLARSTLAPWCVAKGSASCRLEWSWPLLTKAAPIAEAPGYPPVAVFAGNHAQATGSRGVVHLPANFFGVSIGRSPGP